MAEKYANCREPALLVRRRFSTLARSRMARSPDSVSTNESQRPSREGPPKRLAPCPVQTRRTETAGLSSARRQPQTIAGIDNAQNRRRCNREQHIALLRLTLT